IGVVARRGAGIICTSSGTGFPGYVISSREPECKTRCCDGFRPSEIHARVNPQPFAQGSGTRECLQHSEMNWRFCALLIFWASARGQDAKICGLILDPSKASIAGADIALRNEQTGGRRSVQSNESGFYVLSALRPGVYRVTVRTSGFETVVREGIILEVGQRA